MSNQSAGDLKFIGLSEDSEHLIVATPSGEQYRLRVTPMVRAAVRVDRSAMEAAKIDLEGTLPPREIQTRIRSGMTAQEIAEKANVSLDYVKRYEGPVLAERQYIAETAQKVRLSSEPDSPTLGQIVLDRLAARGVNIMDLVWDAYKAAGHGWILTVTFDVDSDIRVARWNYKQAAKQVIAIDEDAKWLSETRIADEPIPKRHLAAVRGEVFDFEASQPTTGQPQRETPDLNARRSSTEQLLDQLDSVRGTRTSVQGTGIEHSRAPIGSSTTPSIADFPTVSTPHATSSQEADVVYDAATDPNAPSGQALIETGEVARVGEDPLEHASAHSNYSERSQASRSSASDEVLHGEDLTVRRENRPSRSQDDSQWAPEHPPLTSALSALTGAPTGESAEPLTPLNAVHDGYLSASAAQRPNAPDAKDLFGQELDEKQVSQAARKGKPRGRSPMPSWDEIMFGAKPE